jgi:hypothetical protein
LILVFDKENKFNVRGAARYSKILVMQAMMVSAQASVGKVSGKLQYFFEPH